MREITEESRDSQNRGETKRRGGKEGEREILDNMAEGQDCIKSCPLRSFQW